MGLVAHSLDNLRVAVALVDSAVGREKVEILLTLAVPHKSALTFGKDNGQRMIVMGTVAGFHFHELF